jgi:phenylpropionate dioxygenase-like ring-hydroxylating dioxygenase large terminal subunit
MTTIDEDSIAAAAAALTREWTLPATWYTDHAHFELERDRVFARSWQYVAHTAELASPGDYVTAGIGRVPIVVTRDAAGRIRGLVNVCRHRSHEVAEGSGNRRTLQCRYHGWTYNLDGTLRAAPRADLEASFERSELCLLPVRVAVWEPFVFATLADDAPPLLEVLGSVPQLMDDYGFQFAALEHRKRIEYTIEANWKVYVENSLECYHCPIAHPALTHAVEMDTEIYRLSADRFVMTHESRLRASGQGAASAGPLLGRRHGVPEFQFYYLWPSFMIAPSPGRLWLGTFRPVDANRTLVITDFYFEAGLPSETVDASAAFSDQVLQEDRALVESVQRGLRSNAVPHGRLLPESEQLLRHFQELVLRAVSEYAGTSGG